ncbi:MFS transporter [Chitinophaga nivalis]|uniref:MFS transporter n=1 Tax=Chitinophaga nivalis TaxID=2991709 RepID=A0ABT3IIA7_9BACT|nr:MFS transporter [Chitinophaga nivalis]MCW3466604.1 MFS transporter [Chitinophaga nivalis]MCW3483705.1 MFS transporter [Chitinophaga nivalis]
MDATFPYPARWRALAVLLMGAFLSPLDFFIVNIALPAMREGLHASSSELQFIVTGYGAAYAVFVVTGGRLGDIYGRKRVFIIGMCVFTLTSAICAFAPNAGILIAARIVQGLSAAMLAPQVLSSIRVIFPAAEQPRAMGLFGATFGLASIAGQLCGGLLLEWHPFGLTWETVFLINIPIGIAAVILAMRFIPENRPEKRLRLDIPGVILISAALFLFIYPLIKGREAGWPLWVFICMALAIPVMLWFVRTEQRIIREGRDPLIYLQLFRDKRFLTGLTVIFLFNNTASFFMVYPVYLQSGFHWTVLQAGLAVLPYAAGFFIGPAVSAALARRFREKVLLIGLLLLSTGFLLSVPALWFQPLPGVVLYAALLCAGVGHGIVMPVIVRMVLAGIPVETAGLAAGVVSTTMQMGSALGVAVLGTVFFSVLPVTGSYASAFMVVLGLLGILEGVALSYSRKLIKMIQQ